MALNRKFSIVTIVLAIAFIINIALVYTGTDVLGILGYFQFLFGVPMIVMLVIAFVYSGYVWFKDRNRINLKYLIHTSIAGLIITVGYIIYIIMALEALSHF